MGLKLTCGILALAIASAAQAKPADSGDARFEALVADYYQEYPAAHPTAATELGLHEHDGDLEDVSQAGIAREVKRLRGWAARFAAVRARALSPYQQNDLAFERTAIASQLVELTEVKSWQRLPDYYPDLASRSVYVLIQRDFASAAARMKSAIAREQKIPAVIAAGKRNLGAVAPVAVDIALDEVDGIIDFFQKDVPLAFASVKDPKLDAALGQSTAEVTRALADYRDFLKKDLKPRAHGSFAIGEKAFRDKLRADEMIDVPTGALLARGEAELHRLQAEFKKTAALIDPHASFADVQHLVQKDHDSADHLLADTQARLAGLRQFIVEHHLVTIPSPSLPKVEETPPFMRATTFASMDTPGPFEKRATQAYYNVTLPEKSWPASQIEDFMRGAFNRPLIDVVSIHEAFPGHYVQFLWVPKVPGLVRKFEGVSTNIEGWAHYCEQMMLDEGYGGNDPRLRLSQLQDALLRAARYVVGIRLHTRGMTLAQAEDFFQREGYQSRKVAEMETR
ncbi:MAG TPA: DUF885 domain-containing protein, partial [Polyangia bacterium]